MAIAPRVVEVVPRPVAPDVLTDAQAEVWDAVVSSLPADWFPASAHGTLASYCRHTVEADRLSQMIERQESYDVNEYDKLLKMRERETRAAMSAATKCRLTPSTQWSEQKSREVKPEKRPWE